MLIKDDSLHRPEPSVPIISLSAHSIQGKRDHMEDFFDIGYQLKPVEKRANQWPFEYFYLGIFDGHGGREAASYAKKHLLSFITKQADFWSDDDEDVKRAIRSGFAETHASMRKELRKWPRTNRVLPSTAGTTASVVFIKNGKFYTGHVGDTRIVISQENPDTKQWISRQLTTDHKPESKLESQRIERAGGEVKNKIGVHRVVWKRPVLVGMNDFNFDHCKPLEYPIFRKYFKQIIHYPVDESFIESYQIIPFLAIARSLGDFWSINPISGQYIVSPEPDVECRPISPDDKCILLATDGLWNVMNSTQAVRMLQELDLLKSGEKEQKCDDQYLTTDNFYDVAGPDSENHAQSLVYYAYQMWERRRLRSDNITAVVAMLHDILNYHQPDEKFNTKANHKNLINNIDSYRAKENGPQVPVQIGPTNSFMEKIRINKEPEFILPDSDELESSKLLWYRLQAVLLFPPEVVKQYDYYNLPDMVQPRNYLRLSKAECKKIPLHDHRSDQFIYIKHVSDDPCDSLITSPRIGKSGKEVRDASAQATQSIHDFGQPWNQMLDDYNNHDDQDDLDDQEDLEDREDGFDISHFDNGDRPGYRNYDDDDDDDPNAEHHDEDEELVFEYELTKDERRRMYGDEDGDSDSDETTEEQVDEELVLEDEIKQDKIPEIIPSPKSKDKKNIPQLRCLLNYTSPLRRSTRNSYQSLSDNSKRKSQINSSATVSKCKRRKSQPIRCDLSKA